MGIRVRDVYVCACVHTMFQCGRRVSWLFQSLEQEWQNTQWTNHEHHHVGSPGLANLTIPTDNSNPGACKVRYNPLLSWSFLAPDCASLALWFAALGSDPPRSMVPSGLMQATNVNIFSFLFRLSPVRDLLPRPIMHISHHGSCVRWMAMWASIPFPSRTPWRPQKLRAPLCPLLLVMVHLHALHKRYALLKNRT